mgnify:CR=1 FL=1
MSNKSLRNVLSKFATGVTIVSTVDHDGKPVGMTANSFTSVSLVPPLVLWSIGINQPSYDVFLKAKGYSVSILSKDQKDICNLFSSSIDNKFSSVDYNLSDNSLTASSPLLETSSKILSTVLLTFSSASIISLSDLPSFNQIAM